MNKFPSATIKLPYLGKLTVGKCIDKNHIEDRIDIPVYLNTSENCFVVSMDGNSMMESGILQNDLLVIESRSTAKNNCMVVATIDNLETVIKYFEQTNDLIFLSSRNKETKPMVFDPSRIKIVGVVVAQMRSYHQ